MSKFNCSILFLAKKNDEYVEKALRFCQSNFTDITYHLSNWGDPLIEDLKSWNGEYIISYQSRWIIPEYVLKKAKIAAINFHPGPPDYPGIGCNNFALYEEAKEYGVTCHHMTPHVDIGTIIDTERFPVFSTDTVETLLSRTYDYQLVLFYKIMNIILKGEKLPISKEIWVRKPFTRKELNNLGQITPTMSKKEIAKRVRATTFDIWKPNIELQGFIFEFKKRAR